MLLEEVDALIIARGGVAVVAVHIAAQLPRSPFLLICYSIARIVGNKLVWSCLPLGCQRPQLFTYCVGASIFICYFGVASSFGGLFRRRSILDYIVLERCVRACMRVYIFSGNEIS